jgi:hypothetical protein
MHASLRAAPHISCFNETWRRAAVDDGPQQDCGTPIRLQCEGMDMEITEIQNALQIYFDVMYECDLDKFDRIFHPSSSLFTMKDGAFNLRPFAQYRTEIAQRTAPKSVGQERTDSILLIDLLSPEIALARVRVRIHEKIFVDNLNLLKFDGQWMIVAKIFHHAETICR